MLEFEKGLWVQIPLQPQFFFHFFFFFFFVFFSILRWFWVKSNPLHLHSPRFIILIILNIVQNLYLHSSMPFILGLHPPYPTSPTYPLPPKKFFFLNFYKSFISLFTSTRPPPPPNPTVDPPPLKKKINLNFHKSFTSPFTSILTPPPPTLPPLNFLFFHFSQ